GLGLLDHLGIERAHLLGGCIGCSVGLTVADRAPERVDRIVLYSPAGGPRYHQTQNDRLTFHAAFVADEGLGAVVELARSTDATFVQDHRVGPWVSCVRRDDEFAAAYAALDRGDYNDLVLRTSDALFARETVPGPHFEALMELPHPVLIAPGNDESHALSAAH